MYCNAVQKAVARLVCIRADLQVWSHAIPRRPVHGTACNDFHRTAPVCKTAAPSVLYRHQQNSTHKSRANFVHRAGGTAADPKGYYALLGIPPERRASATAADIRRAYRLAAKRLHPDTQADKSAGARASAAAKFQALQKAYDVLRDAAARRRYNAGHVPD